MNVFLQRRSEIAEEDIESVNRRAGRLEDEFDYENSIDDGKPKNVIDDMVYDKKWEWGYLRARFANLEFEPFYNTYTQRLQRSYLSLFIVLQALVGVTHSILLVSAAKFDGSIFPEIFCYLAIILIIWASLFITFKEDFIKQRQWVAYVASFIVVLSLVISDLTVPLYHSLRNFVVPELRPTYGSYALYAIYIFLPLSENWLSFCLGAAVTACYLIEFALVTYRRDDNYLIKTGTEAIFLIFVNFFGIYFRLMKEIAIRTTFLDRGDCVEENLRLRYARDQEKSLLLSILPANTADYLEKDVREKIENMKSEKKNKRKNSPAVKANYANGNGKKWIRPPVRELHIEVHHDVSILYADIVNYTFMTTKLPVKELVDTLHELFVKFDQASEEHNVLRIKFLGDCYYCVSGVISKNLQHAKSCVDLGLRMIREIREVNQNVHSRLNRKINIDMRIGVHSGSILSGIIGACKWQYDIWSKDVDIANRLESTGEAGKVHVSRQTLNFLNGSYMYKQGTEKAKNDMVLRKYGIETFLIVPYAADRSEDPRYTTGVRRILEKNRASNVPVRKILVQDQLEQFNQLRAQVKLEMASELDKMPIGKFHLNRFCFDTPKRYTEDELEEQNLRSNVSTLFLLFKDFSWESLFLIEPDVMLKYSTLIGFITYLAILAVEGTNLPRGVHFWIANGISGFILILFIPITWFKKLWVLISNDEPRCKFFAQLSEASHAIMRSILSRVIIYFIIVFVLCTCSLFHLIECQQYEEFINESNNPIKDIGSQEHRLCFNSWAITESMILTICMSFLFVRIPFLIKFVVGFLIVSVYGWIVFVEYSFIYEHSGTTNNGLDPKYAHIFTIVLTFGIFHMVDRQTEYIAKVDYNWKQQLQKKREVAKFTNDTIKILIENILPAHVADIYVSRTMKDELYHERYDNVAIMFATIKNIEDDDDLKHHEKTVLEILNGIISDFDEILMSYTIQNRKSRSSNSVDGIPLKIEKIKIAGWTYMAACGPFVGGESNAPGGGRSSKLKNKRPTSITLNGRRSGHQGIKHLSMDAERHRKIGHLDQTAKQAFNPVYVMTEFALKLMRALQSFNEENFQKGVLRVGICHGEIIAGIVGSSKPLYDIWGDAVNMASRMDSTGIPGRIQVPEETASVLQSFGIKCEYRGQTPVKGKGDIPTYFVCIDKDLNFVKDTTNFFNNPSTSRRAISNPATPTYPLDAFVPMKKSVEI